MVQENVIKITRIFLSLLLVMAWSFPKPVLAAATQVDSLIQKLVEKGILNKQEARELKMEIAEDAKIIQEDSAKAVVPDWVKNTKIKGDVRVRYQYERRQNDTESRTRGRSRVRLGVENEPAKNWKIGAGLATAAVDKNTATTVDDPRSTNATFEDSFSRGTIRLDYAFGEYQAAPWAKVIAGKYVKTDYLWTPTDMLWDTDINPAGASIHLEHKLLKDPLTVFANSGVWVIDENGKTDRTDPFLFYTQGGLKYKDNIFDATIAGVYYGFNGVKGIALDATASTNTLAGSVLKHDYDSVGFSAEFAIKKPIMALPIERVAIFGDFINNVSPEVDNNFGWATGVKVGDEKVGGPKQWQVKYQWTTLGKDAFPDSFPDSDRLGGATDIKGHEWELLVGLTKNVYLGFDYYQDARIKTTKNPQKLVQADLNLKF